MNTRYEISDSNNHDVNPEYCWGVAARAAVWKNTDEEDMLTFILATPFNDRLTVNGRNQRCLHAWKLLGPLHNSRVAPFFTSEAMTVLTSG